MKETRQRWIYVVGILLATVMIASVLLPLLPQQQIAATLPPPTAVPVATFPAPPSDLASISFEQRYLHPSGLYTVAQPTGFTPTSPSNNGQQVQINLNNSTTQAVIEAILDVPAEPYASLDALSTQLDGAFLDNSWRRYTSWTETGRRIDETNQRLIIDFELSLNRQTYLARHAAWLDENGSAEMVRVVAPANARDYLLHLLDGMIPTLERVPFYADSPTGWTAFNADGLIVRYPATWQVTDGAAGRPVTVEGSGQVLRVEAVADAAATDEAAAEAFLTGIRPTATVASVQPVERNGFSGFSVAFNETSLDGAGTSGLALLLNGSDNTLYSAVVRVPQAGLDLNAVSAGSEEAAAVSDALNILQSFTPSEPLALPQPAQAAVS
jgi:hypothetical protein